MNDNEWNSLPDEIISATSLQKFKSMISIQETLNYFDLHLGTRFCQIIHCRLKLGCSDLNAHRYNRHISDTAKCSCGNFNEDVIHYLFMCRKYQHQRLNMFFYVQGYDVKTTLYGSGALDKATNNRILNSLHKFICDSKRFTVFH